MLRGIRRLGTKDLTSISQQTYYTAYILFSHCIMCVAIVSQIIHSNFYFKIKPFSSLPFSSQPYQAAYIISSHCCSIAVVIVSQIIYSSFYCKIKLLSLPTILWPTQAAYTLFSHITIFMAIVSLKKKSNLYYNIRPAIYLSLLPIQILAYYTDAS